MTVSEQVRLDSFYCQWRATLRRSEWDSSFSRGEAGRSEMNHTEGSTILSRSPLPTAGT